MFGFYIKSIKMVGDGKEDAEVIFEKGLNVIHGPSNTGKSYVFQCIDYAFGAKKIKKVPESKGYSKLYLEIRQFDTNKPLTILRFLESNEIYYYLCGVNEIEDYAPNKLKSKHDPAHADNISKFLLKQTGIEDNKYLVKNQDGKKVTLGFRALAHLTIISETDIISEEKSPVLDTDSSQQTYSKSVFRYLLTSQDDIACAELEKAEIRKAKNEAKIEYIKDEIITLNQERDNLRNSKNEIDSNGVSSLEYYKDNINEIEKTINQKRQELQNINTANNKLNLQKNKVQIMLDKFQLLKRQYLSDLDRLDFIADGDNLFTQIPHLQCPLCDSIVPKTDEESNFADITKCCSDEKAKIEINLKELENSIKDLNAELKLINEMLSSGDENASAQKEEINRISEQDLQPLKVVIKALIEQAQIDSKINDIGKTIERKAGEIIVFEESKRVKQDSVTDGLIIDQQIYDELCSEIKRVLNTCGYSEVKEVKFDVKSQDIVIDGVHRLSNGKGYRAFFYAVFSAALMICLNKMKHSFSNVLVLDSPLTTLKESELEDRQDDDFVENTLQDGLFTFFADEFKDKQAIIIDNKQPPKSLAGKYHDIPFSRGQNNGRYGFFKK